MIEKRYSIYSLNEPSNIDVVRYIGLTSRSLNARLKSHLSDKYISYKTNWIKSLKSDGLKPIIVLIEENLTLDEAQYMEVEYIKLFKTAGARLTNGTSGGEGTTGHKVTEDEKKRLSELWTGYRHSDEAKAKMKKHWSENENPFKGRKHTEESLKKISDNTRGKNLGESNPSKRPEVRAKIGAFHKGKVISEEQKRNHSEKMTGRTLTEDHRQKVIAPLMESNIKKRRPIIQLDLSGNIIQRFDYAKLANIAMGKKWSDGNIAAACKGNLKTAYGFKWQYANN